MGPAAPVDMGFKGVKRVLDPSNFATADEHAEQVDEANRKKSRAKRPGQLPPSSRGQRNRSVDWDDDSILEDPAGDSRCRAACPESECTDWAARKQQEDEHWRANRQRNQQMAQQHEAYDGPTISQLRVDGALHCAAQALSFAVIRHCCCI